MPTISVFYGIKIYMYFPETEHMPPHIHAFYGDKNAKISLENGEILTGDLPITAKKLVKEFVLLHQNELNEMWNTGKFRKLKGLE